VVLKLEAEWKETSISCYQWKKGKRRRN